MNMTSASNKWEFEKARLGGSLLNSSFIRGDVQKHCRISVRCEFYQMKIPFRLFSETLNRQAKEVLWIAICNTHRQTISFSNYVLP